MRGIESGNFNEGDAQASIVNGLLPERPAVLARTEEEVRLEEINGLQDREKEILKVSEGSLSQEINPKKRAKKFLKLASYFLSSVVAFGASDESLFAQTAAGRKPEKATVEAQAEIKARSDEKLFKYIEAERKNDFAYIKETVEKNGVKEKIDFLTTKYGTVPGKFFRDAKFIVETVEEIEKDVKNETPGIFCDTENPYFMTKASILSLSKPKWSDPTPEDIKAKSTGFKVEGFENSGIFTAESAANDEMRSELEKIYSPQWLGASEITFVKEKPGQEEFDQKARKEYGLESGSPVGTAQTDIFGQSKIEVLSSMSGSKYMVLGIAHHELAHNNDWENSQMLSTQQRLDFLCEATKTFESSKNFVSPYVYNIKNEDKKIELYLKVKEYWAETVKQYMENGAEEYRVTNPKEAGLVEKWFNIMNGAKK